MFILVCAVEVFGGMICESSPPSLLVSISHVCRKLFDNLVAEGYELTKVPFEEWCDRVSTMDDSNSCNGQSSVKRMLEAVTNSRSLLSKVELH